MCPGDKEFVSQCWAMYHAIGLPRQMTQLVTEKYGSEKLRTLTALLHFSMQLNIASILLENRVNRGQSLVKAT